jgi:hypothetical protein
MCSAPGRHMAWHKGRRIPILSLLKYEFLMSMCGLWWFILLLHQYLDFHSVDL